jgi:aryl-alcohol dehydrogenase-like predicted oxidoreductase
VIDTAECYNNGDVSSEALIGRAVGHRRGDFHLFTKVGHASGLDGEDWDPEMMARSIDRSLERLRVDAVDLIQLHTCSEEMLRQGDVIDVLRRARDAGKTRFIGYSGDSHAARYAIECGAFDTLQTSVNLADQECAELTLPLALERRMGVIAKRPIANVAWGTGATPPESEYRRPYWERLRKLQYPFLDGPDAVATALRFTLSLPGVTTAIVGTTRPERWQENAALLAKGPLSPEEMRQIRDRWQAVKEPDWTGQG